MLESIVQYCNAIHPMSEELTSDLLAYAQIRTFAKDEYILKAGQVSNHASFVLAGLVRSYYMKDEEEITTKFMHDGSTITSIYSFYSRKPGTEYIVALEDTTLASFHYNDLQKLFRQHTEFNYIGRVITERYLLFLELELYNLRKHKGEERYQFFTTHFPHLLQRVPLKYIATYLGMSVETISRIRGRKR